MEEMTCPVCGKKFNSIDIDFLDNGNPACKNCAEADREKDDFSENNER